MMSSPCACTILILRFNCLMSFNDPFSFMFDLCRKEKCAALQKFNLTGTTFENFWMVNTECNTDSDSDKECICKRYMRT